MKQVKNIMKYINYLQMRRKIFDDYMLKYLNDLLGIKLIFYNPSRMLQLSEFVLKLRSSVRVVLTIFSEDRSKISSDHPFHFL